MKKQMYINTLAVVVSLFLGVAMANAQATRTWVSGVGDDVNPCSRTAPCKTFAGAISKTAEGGEIDALDPGGFGGVTITKAMTIEGTHGSGFGSILNASVTGVTINVTTGVHVSDAVVILRSLYIQGASQSTSGTGASRGVNYIKGARVFIDDCHFENQTTSGITGNLTTAGALFVKDSDFTNTNVAITATTTVNPLTLNVTNITVYGNTSGVVYTSNTSGTVTESTFAHILGGDAISAGTNCFANVTHCHFSNNSTAIRALAGSTIRVNENELFDNGNGFAGIATSLQSGGNNKLAGNGANVIPTGTPLLTQ
jgi:hypothetical protein